TVALPSALASSSLHAALPICVVRGEVPDLVLDRRPAAAGGPRRLRHLTALVDEAVDALRPAHEVLAGPRVAGDDDAPAAALEVEAVRRLHRVVLDEERAHRDAAGLDQPALLDLRHAHVRRLP